MEMGELKMKPNMNFPTLDKSVAPVANQGMLWVESSGRVLIDCFTDSGASPLSNQTTARLIAYALENNVPLRKPHAFYDADRDVVLPSRIGEHLGWGDDLRIFYTNSGSEAIETAIKTARRATDRATVVGISGDFHGRTYGAMSLQYNDDRPEPEYHYRGYGPFVPAMYPLTESDAANIPLPHHVAALVVSPVNMNNTLELWPRWVWEAAADIRRDGGLIIFDEVQTGFGRGGGVVSITEGKEWRDLAETMFPAEPDLRDVMLHPDIICFGKAMAGGFPMSATVTREPIARVMGPGSHFNTMAGSPLGVFMSLEFIQWLEEGNLDDYLDWATSLAAKRKNILRCGGLMALAVREPQAWALKVREQYGLYVAANRPNNPIRFYPPLDLQPHEREVIETILDRTL
jgi:acetylornithine/succinyldiaminopimelate/putrescine aminotransferase